LAKKVSRKDLKEPDEFLSFTARAFSWLNEQKVILIIGVAAVGLVIIGSYIWQWYAESREKKASVAFIEAKEILAAPVIPKIEGMENAVIEGSYPSDEEKYKAAIKELEKVTQEHSSSSTSILAIYFIGESYLRLGEYDKAIEKLKEYLTREGENGELAAFAMEGIAVSLEALGKDADAKQQYKRLTQPPLDIEPDRGLYHIARLEQKAGKTAQAVRLFNEILEKHPQTAFRQEIQDRLNQLPKVDNPKEESGEEAKQPEKTEVKGPEKKASEDDEKASGVKPEAAEEAKDVDAKEPEKKPAPAVKPEAEKAKPAAKTAAPTKKPAAKTEASAKKEVESTKPAAKSDTPPTKEKQPAIDKKGTE
jgi:tetratricopeptide (TPR) repeat protein